MYITAELATKTKKASSSASEGTGKKGSNQALEKIKSPKDVPLEARKKRVAAINLVPYKNSETSITFPKSVKKA